MNRGRVADRGTERERERGGRRARKVGEEREREMEGGRARKVGEEQGGAS